MQTIKRLLGPVSKTKKVRWIGVVVMLNWFAFDVATVFVTKYVGDQIQDQQFELLPKILIIYGLFFVVSFGLKYILRRESMMRGRYMRFSMLWKEFHKKFFGSDISALEKIGTGRIVEIASTGVKQWTNALCELQLVSAKVIAKFGVVVVLFIQLGWWYIPIFILLLVVVIILVSYAYRRLLLPLKREKKLLRVANLRHLVRLVMSHVEVLQNKMVDVERNLFDKNISAQREIAFAELKWVFVVFNSPLILAHAFYPLVLLYVIISTQQGTFSLGLFLAMTVVASQLGSFMINLTTTYREVSEMMVDVEKLRTFYDETPRLHGYNTGASFEYKQGHIDLRNVTFSYTDNQPVIKNVSLTIPGGTVTALVGHSGGGKSTIVKCIAGYLRPDTGSVRVDGQDLTSVSLESYFGSVGYLTQEPGVFDGTIRENLYYGSEQDDAGLWQALENAQCEFVRTMPEGLETEIGERGVRLSGGQRQRLAIAKLFLKNPRIVILDEPTAALDSVSEQAITEALHRLFENRTVIIIAHRLQTVKSADDIVVVEDGSIVQRGTHTDLASQPGIYKDMVELQSGF